MIFFWKLIKHILFFLIYMHSKEKKKTTKDNVE